MNIFNDKNLDDIDNKINNLTSLLNTQTVSISNTTEISSDILSVFNNKDDMSSILSNINIPQDRLARYNIYDEMYNSVPLVKRMISVYISNIMSKNPVTSKAFIYKDLKEKQTDNDKEITQEKTKKICQEIVDYFKLEDKLKNVILPYKLTYGDFFIEVLNISDRLNKLELKKTSTQLFENFVDNIPRNTNTSIDYYLREASTFLVEKSDNIEEELQNIFENSEENISEENKFQNILLKYHKPHNIIILNTKYETCLGYLEVLKPNENETITINSMVQKITNLAAGKSNTDKIIDKLIYYVTRQIFKVNNKKESLVKTLDDNSLNLIKRFFIEQDMDLKYRNRYKYKKMNVRFISVNQMVHFKSNGSVEYSPFSRSVIDPLVFVGKLYMLTQLSNAISKLSRSSAIRKWTIDPGTSRMTGQMVNRLKRELYNTRVTINDLGSFKSMANILSDFKDMFVIRQNGQTPVDVDFQRMGDPSIKVQDLQDLRQELISLSGIPAVYLGYQDSVELREQLMHINVSFATEIIDMQENDIKGINRLISIICKSLNIEDPTKYTQVSLLPPIVLIVQLIESTLGSVGNIVSVFQNMNIKIDPFYFLEQYVQQIDWVKFKEAAQKYNIDEQIKTELEAKKQTTEQNTGY